MAMLMLRNELARVVNVALRVDERVVVIQNKVPGDGGWVQFSFDEGTTLSIDVRLDDGGASRFKSGVYLVAQCSSWEPMDVRYPALSLERER
jgi:hypothetical protein